MFAGGLWAICQIVRLQLFEKRWQRLTLTMLPMCAWLFFWMLVLLQTNTASILLAAGSGLLFGAPLLFLIAGLFVKRVRESLHRYSFLVLLCCLLAGIAAYLGGSANPPLTWLMAGSFIDVSIAVFAMASLTAATFLMSRLARRLSPALEQFHSENAELYLVYNIAIWMTANIFVLIICFGHQAGLY